MTKQGWTCRAGFTLVEAVVVIVILSILMGIAVPRFEGFFANKQLDSAQLTLLGILKETQAVAIKTQSKQIADFRASEGDDEAVILRDSALFRESRVVFGAGSEFGSENLEIYMEIIGVGSVNLFSSSSGHPLHWTTVTFQPTGSIAAENQDGTWAMLQQFSKENERNWQFGLRLKFWKSGGTAELSANERGGIGLDDEVLVPEETIDPSVGYNFGREWP